MSTENPQPARWAGVVPSASADIAVHLVALVDPDSWTWSTACPIDGIGGRRHTVHTVRRPVDCPSCLAVQPSLIAAVNHRVEYDAAARAVERGAVTRFLAWAAENDAVLAGYAGDTKLHALLEHGRERLINDWMRETGKAKRPGPVPVDYAAQLQAGFWTCAGCGDDIWPSEPLTPRRGGGGAVCLVCAVAQERQEGAR